MNKLRQLRRKLIRSVGIALGIVAAFGAVLMLTDNLADSAAQKKTAAISKLGQDQAQLANLKNQITKSGTAEKRFVDIEAAHTNKDFSANSDAMKDFLRKSKDQFRLGSNLKMTLAPEKSAEKPEFSGLNYDVMVREPMRIEFEAMSDVHAYAFLDHLLRDAPGFVRLTRFELKRKGDLDADTLTKMNNGEAPSLVEAVAEFTWVGVTPKKLNTPAKPPAGGAVMRRQLTLSVAMVLIASSTIAQPPPTAPITPGVPTVDLPVAPGATAAQALPAVPAATLATKTDTVTVPPPVAETKPEEPEKFSFGNQPFSLFYTPDQVQAMKNVLTNYETRLHHPAVAAAPGAAANNDQAISQFLAPAAPKVITEPATYPVFYLGSIVFHDAKDWTVWLSDHRITPKNNRGELQVAAISADAVKFSWKPDYMSSLARRQQEHKFAPLDKIKNRLTTTETAMVDSKQDAILFTLRPNQSFSAAHMSTFEGKVTPTVLPPLEAQAAPLPANVKLGDAAQAVLSDMAGAQPGSKNAAAGVDQATINTLQDLIKTQQKFSPNTTKSQVTNQAAPSAKP